MALMSKCVVTEPSSFEEAVEDPAWVDAMVEEYDSIAKNSLRTHLVKATLFTKLHHLVAISTLPLDEIWIISNTYPASVVSEFAPGESLC